LIELFTADTPNGKKITIMLEELSCDFKVTAIDLSKDDQFKPDFKKISPFGKIPIIIDHENKESVFESGAILMYLAEKYNKFYEAKDRNVINQWLMAQMGTIGPMLGQHHQFHHQNTWLVMTIQLQILQHGPGLQGMNGTILVLGIIKIYQVGILIFLKEKL
jgi:GST-like protein